MLNEPTPDENDFSKVFTLGNVFSRINDAFRKVDMGVESIDRKLEKVSRSARSTFSTFTSSVMKGVTAVDKMNDALEKQNRLIRKMPKAPSAPPASRPHPTRPGPTGTGTPPRTPQGQGRGGGRGGDRGGGGGSRFRFGGTSSGHVYAGGFGGLGGLGTLGAAYGIGSIARGFGSFDANIHTLMAEAGPDIQNVGGQKGLTQSILDISGSTQFSSGETAELLIQMVKDGVKLNDALANIPSVLKLAVAESTDLTTAWNTTNTFVSGLNVPLSESVRLMDMMSNATSLSKLKLENIQYIAGQSLALYKEIGGFSEEGFLGISGILGPLFRPERIGTGLKQLSLLLPQAASGQLAGSKNDVFQQWGVNITDAAGNLKDEVSVLKEFERVMGGMTGEQRNVELAKVFGTEAAPVFAALIGQSAKLAENMQAIRKKGTLDEKFAVHAESLTNKFKLLTSAGDSLIKKFVMILNEGNAFGGGIGWVTGKITQLTTYMEANKATIQAWWGNFREIVGGLFNFVAKGIETVAGFWAGLSEGEKTIVAIGAVIGAFVLGPVTGLIAAGALIISKWDEIKDFFEKLWDKMDEPVLGFLKTVRDGTMSVVNWVRGQWDEMSPYFEKIWSGISFIASQAWQVIRSVAAGAWEAIKIAWGPVSAYYKVLWQGVLLATEVAWFAVKNTIKAVVIAVEFMWNGLKAVFNWAPVKWIRSGFMALVDFFGGLVVKLRSPFEDFVAFVTGVFEKIAKGIETVRGWFRRGEEGEHRLVLTVDAEQAQKEVKSAVGAAGTLKTKMDANAPKIKRVPESMRNLTPKQFIQKQKSDTFLQEALPTAVSQLISNLATAQASGRILPREADKTDYYQTRAKTAEAASGISKPEASYQDFLKSQEKKASEASRRSKAFGINLKPRSFLGTRAVEDLYKIDDRAMSNVREHFEDVAEKEFFSGLETYAKQSFSHIDSTLTEAQRSMREKTFAAQKFLREDAERWKKTLESGVLDRLSASVEAAGVSAKSKETYGYLQKALAGDSFLSLPMKYQQLQADNIPSVLQPLQGRISPEKLSEVIDMFQNLSKNAAYIPDMQRALKIDSLSEDIGKSIEVAGLKRGHDLLTEVMTTGDTVTQAKKRLPEPDAALLQSAFERLKEHADQLPMMRKLLGREQMLTGEPQGTKMNVFEFPTLTAEQHEALTSTFNSGFLSLIDIESAQLAVLQSIANLLGGDFKKASGAGPVIKQQKGTLFDDYLSHRHSETQKQVFEQIKDNVPQAVTQPPARQPVTTSVVAKDTPKAEILPVVNVEAMQPAPTESVVMPEPSVPSAVSVAPVVSVAAPSAPVIETVHPTSPAINEATSPELPSVVPKREMPSVVSHPDTLPLPAPKEAAVIRESPVNIAQPEMPLEPMITPEMPIVSPQIEDAAAPYAPVIEPQVDTRFENILDSLQPQPPTPQSEQVTATGQEVVKAGQPEKTAGDMIFNITIEGAEKTGEELVDEMMAALQERMREKNF